MTYTTTVTSKGQITLPAELRRALGIHSGKRIEVTRHGDSIIVKTPVDILDVREENRVFMRQSGKASPTKDQIEIIKAAQLRQKYGL